MTLLLINDQANFIRIMLTKNPFSKLLESATTIITKMQNPFTKRFINVTNACKLTKVIR